MPSRPPAREIDLGGEPCIVTWVTELAPAPLRPPADGTLRLERPGRPYTVAEVDAAGDEGAEWWEADEGVLIVNAPPSLAHQRMVAGLVRAWQKVAGRDRWLVLTGPQRVVLNELTWMEPDVAIWPAGEVDLTGGGSTPGLVAEVLASATARRDRQHKPALYARAGVAWLVLAQPADAPSVEVFQLEAAGKVRRVASAVGDDSLTCPLTGADLTPAGVALG
jgi:Uma2 family endonuclease